MYSNTSFINSKEYKPPLNCECCVSGKIFHWIERKDCKYCKRILCLQCAKAIINPENYITKVDIVCKDCYEIHKNKKLGNN